MVADESVECEGSFLLLPIGELACISLELLIKLISSSKSELFTDRKVCFSILRGNELSSYSKFLESDFFTDT